MSFQASSGLSAPTLLPPRVFVGDAGFSRCESTAAEVRRNRMHVVGCATTCSDVIAGAAYSEPDACLLAVELEDGRHAGLSALQRLNAVVPLTRTILMLDSSDSGIVVDAFRKGAKGVLCRQQVLSRLGKCIRCVLAGQIWANSAQLEFVIDDLRHGAGMFGSYNALKRRLTDHA
jgi:DNA-binding NarL/FixJ family response regulator